jgi:hypothetical protein
MTFRGSFKFTSDNTWEKIDVSSDVQKNLT